MWAGLSAAFLAQVEKRRVLAWMESERQAQLIHSGLYDRMDNLLSNDRGIKVLRGSTNRNESRDSVLDEVTCCPSLVAPSVEP